MERRRIEKGQVDDLVLLEQASEDAIVNNLRTALKDDRIYTWIGPVLISVNPFRAISGLYTPALLRKYRGRHTWELAPHVFAVAEDAYTSLMSTHANQCILITGESGAGKTEAAKKVMEYVAAVSPLTSAADVNAKDRLLQSNPVLEAFGNAKTIRNNNSSRFGKYMELVFDFAGRPVGGKISNYLLEKPRVVAPAVDERSFHIFYLLLAGADPTQRTELYLAEAAAYTYLAHSGCFTVKGFDDADEYLQMRSAMGLVGFSEEQQVACMRLVGAVLSLGNITFGGGGAAGSKPHRATAGAGHDALVASAKLLGVDTTALEKALTHHTITSAMESVTSPLAQPDDCVESTRAFGRALYARMFTSIVDRVNEAIKPPTGMSLTMGVLDIYGFEIFELNSFEQLCINYCNEKLQQFFIELTLRSEQSEYASEGIDWVKIDFFNNQTVCELIEGKRPAGILAYLDEESLVPKGTDASLYAKLREKIQHAHFSVPDAKALSRQAGAGSFTIVHYAGDVVYSSAGLLDKNKDALFRDLLECGGASRSPLVAGLFPEAKVKAGAGKRPLTAATQFRTSMSELVMTLTKCQPRYIRTIKPNDDKRAGAFDTERVSHQVRYLGLLENVRVRRAGFAYRPSFESFAMRFRLLSPTCWPVSPHAGDAKMEALTVLQENSIGKEAYEVGRTKLFVRAPITLFALEELRKRRCEDITRILQVAWRAYKARKYYMELRERAKGIFMGRKRRRGSWSLYFMGDYVGASESAELTRLLSKHSESRILFADVIEKVNRNRKAQERVLVVSESSLYTCTRKYKETNRVPLHALASVSLSTFADGYMVLHVREGTKGVPADLLISSVRKAELLTTLVSEAQLRGRELPLAFADVIRYRSKKGGGVFASGLEARTLEFAEDDSYGMTVAVAHLEPLQSAADKMRLLVRVSPRLASRATVQLEASKVSHTPTTGGGGGLLSRMLGGEKRGGQPQGKPVPTPPPPKASNAPTIERAGSARGLAVGGGSGGGAYGTPCGKLGGGSGTAGGGADGYAPNYGPGARGRQPAPLPPNRTSQRQSFSSFPQAQAAWEYKATNADELSFKVGDLLRILEHNGEWWTAIDAQGKTGQVPSNFIKML